MTKIDIPAVILAGGKSSRMGKDKALLPFEKYNSLCEYQYNKLQELFSKVYISTKEDKFDFVKDKNLLFFDTSKISSPMVALNSILESIKAQKFFLITVDTPLVSLKTIQELLSREKKSNKKVIIPKDQSGKIHNLCGVFNTDIKDIVKESLEKDIHKISYLLEKAGYETISFDTMDEFLNLNTQEEYKKAVELLRLK